MGYVTYYFVAGIFRGKKFKEFCNVMVICENFLLPKVKTFLSTSTSWNVVIQNIYFVRQCFKQSTNVFSYEINPLYYGMSCNFMIPNCMLHMSIQCLEDIRKNYVIVHMIV